MDSRNTFSFSVLLPFFQTFWLHSPTTPYTDVVQHDSGEEKTQQPFPSVFHCHALKIALKQLHHRPLNKQIYTLLKAFSWRHGAIGT